MTPVTELSITQWNREVPETVREHAIGSLEEGSVLFFPTLAFDLGDDETSSLLSSAASAKSKNVSFDVAGGGVRGTALDPPAAERLERMMRRFAGYSRELVLSLLPRYAAGLSAGRTSFRPAEIAGRPTSWRKDDTRLHVDSFPSSPTQGRRILRVFCNVNPEGRSRSWRLGEPFEQVAARFLPSIPPPLWGSGQALRLLRVTKSLRSSYDHYMLQLHDRMKADLEYQSGAPQITRDFPPGSTWIVFTDQVSHAAMAGQYLLEQTFYLPVEAMADPMRSPLRTLERMKGRRLV